MKRNTGKTIKKTKVKQTNSNRLLTSRNLFIPFIGQEEGRVSVLVRDYVSFLRLNNTTRRLVVVDIFY
jgi:hypothetical protein